MKPFTVRTGGGTYPVLIERGALASLGKAFQKTHLNSRAFVVSDDTVWRLYGDVAAASLNDAGMRWQVHTAPAGEQSKSADVLLGLYSAMAKAAYSRSDAVIALGGGVIGDLAGMAAATFLRGMAFVQVPTTLLAQVDSSIGGKVAIDIPEGKNLVGAFHQPSLVLIDPNVLDTLPDRQFSCGMAEVIKHGAIADRALFEKLEHAGDRKALRRSMNGVIRANLAIKRAVVQKDERDNGPRMMLNFGHTIGHALEKQAGYAGLTHGEAVAIGMCHITRKSEELGLTAPGTAQRLEALCDAYNLPPTLPDGAREELLETMARDKKVRGGAVTLVLLKGIGQCFLHSVKLDEMGRFL